MYTDDSQTVAVPCATANAPGSTCTDPSLDPHTGTSATPSTQVTLTAIKSAPPLGGGCNDSDTGTSHRATLVERISSPCRRDAGGAIALFGVRSGTVSYIRNIKSHL